MSTTRYIRGAARRLAVPALALIACAAAQGQMVIPEWTLPPLYGEESPNYITVAAGVAFTEGDTGAFSERSGFKEALGGIEDLHYFKEFEEAQLLVDMQALAGSYDGRVDIEYEKWDAWYIKGGFEQAHTFYDASGGFYPAGALWVTPDEQYRSLDRGAFRVEWGTLDTSKPLLRIRYSHHYRDGDKNSTSWGQASAAKIAPAWRDINETRDVLEIDVEKQTEKQRWGAGLRVEHAETRNSLNTVNSFPGAQEQQEEVDTTSGSAHAHITRKLNKKATLSVGGSVLALDANISGARTIANGSAFVDLYGDADLTRYELDTALHYQWRKDLHSTLTLGAAKEEQDGYTAKNNGLGPNFNTSETEDSVFDASLQTRYRGISKTLLYATLEGSSGDGELAEAGDNINRRTDSDQSSWKIKAGGRWYPMSNLSLNLEYYHRNRSDDYDNVRFDAFPTTYPGYVESLDYETDNLSARISWRPATAVTLVTRLHYRLSTTTAAYSGLSVAQEADLDTLSFSQSASWTPRDGLYLQGMFNYTTDTLETPASELGGGLSGLVQETENDYWNLNLNAFAIIDEKTDAQVSYDYYYAGNYADNTPVGTPFGVAEREHRLSLILSRQLRERTRAQMRYAYYNGKDDASGGFNDYEAHLVYLGIRKYF